MKGKKPPFFAPRTDQDENKLDELKKKEINLADTALGWLVDVQKQEHTAAFWLSSCDEHKILKNFHRLHDAKRIQMQNWGHRQQKW